MIVKQYELVIYPLNNENKENKIASVTFEFEQFSEIINKITELKNMIDNKQVMIVINNVLDKTQLFS